MFCTFTPPIEYTVRMKNEKTPQVHQKECEACDQVITLGAPNDEVRFCFDCIEKVEAYERMNAEELDELFDVKLTDDDIEAWADLWEEKEAAEEGAIVYDFYADPKV